MSQLLSVVRMCSKQITMLLQYKHMFYFTQALQDVFASILIEYQRIINCKSFIFLQIKLLTLNYLHY